MNSLSRSMALKIAAVISFIWSAYGIVLSLPLISVGAEANNNNPESAPYVVLVLALILGVIGIIAAYGAWKHRPLLDELGLAGALQNIKFPDPEACFEVHIPVDLPRLSAALEVAIYRIAIEAVHNVVKHAQAKACVIDITVDGGRLTLSVSDDGWFTGGETACKQVMTAIPLALVIQREEEQVAALQDIQHCSAIIPTGDRITQRRTQPVKNRGLQQEAADHFRLLKNFFDQIVQDVTVAAGERLDKTGSILVALHRNWRTYSERG